MTLRDQMAVDFANVALNVGEFAELISYEPSGGTAITLTAIIDRGRMGPTQRPQLGDRAATRETFVMIARGSGVGRETVSLADKVVFTLKAGEAPIRCRILSVNDSDPGCWILRVGP